MKNNEGQKEINEKIAVIEQHLKELVDLSEKHGICVYWDGPSYGMGGTYIPKTNAPDYYTSDEVGTWQASSHSC